MTERLKGTIYSMKGESEDVYRVGTQDRVGYLIYNIAHYLAISEDEAVKLLQQTDYDNPVRYYDEIFWVEED